MSAYAAYRLQNQPRRYVGLAWTVGLHVLLLGLLLSGVLQSTVQRVLKKPEPVVLQQVSLPPPPEPAPPPKAAVPQAQPAAPLPQRAPVLPEAAPAPPEAPARIERAADPAPVPATAPAPVVHAAPPVEVLHKPASSASAEAEYAARVKALLNASKRYPTGRQASQQRPQGVVKLWFVLNRAGTLLEAGLPEPADSNLLNDAALATVRRAGYPPFGAELWPGQEQHRFTVDIDFLPPG